MVVYIVMDRVILVEKPCGECKHFRDRGCSDKTSSQYLKWKEASDSCTLDVVCKYCKSPVTQDYWVCLETEQPDKVYCDGCTSHCPRKCGGQL